MRRSPELRELRNILIALGVLMALIVAAAIATFGVGGGDGHQTHAGSGSTVTKTVPPTTATPTTTAPTITYQVQRGDSLSTISRRFGVSIASIAAANQLADRDRLSEGQALLIPPSRVALVIAPAATTAGRTVELQLTGVEPSSEVVIFEVESPTGTFTGPPHPVPSDGTVTASFTPAFDAPAGTYTVRAKGDQGTSAQATFVVQPTGP
jgi:LysM repeat protein